MRRRRLVRSPDLRARLALTIALVVIGVGGGIALYLRFRPPGARLARLREYRLNPGSHEDWVMHVGDRCGEAPFLFPTDGLVGFVWGDSFRPGHRHQGLDIFGPDGLGATPVVAAFDGYLTRQADWHSAVIVRIPEDPLRAGRQIWTYYTHMADSEGRSFISADYPAGTREKFVRAGTRLGYQGNYSADPLNPVGIHLHFSIVLDDGRGQFRNELEFGNTLDPTPYFGFELNADRLGESPVVCPTLGAAGGEA